MKNIKTFEQFTQDFSQVDEAFLGIKNKEERAANTVMQMKGLLKYFIDKKSGKNYKYWFNHLAKKELSEMKDSIDSYFMKLQGTKGAHVFGGGNKGTGGFALDIVNTLAKDPNAYDAELVPKIKEICGKLNIEPKVICDKLGLECGDAQGQA